MAANIYGHSGPTANTSGYTPGAIVPRRLKGPPRSGQFAYGIYILQHAANQDYRWFDDVQTPGTKAPTTYTEL